MIEILNKFVDQYLVNAKQHFAEKVLIRLFWVTVALMVYTNHTHNDEMGRWATVAAGNIMSALFGIITGKYIAQPTTPPTLPPTLPPPTPEVKP